MDDVIGQLERARQCADCKRVVPSWQTLKSQWGTYYSGPPICGACAFERALQERVRNDP